ncbi:MAG: iron-sulfur cluster insertion protein ErpA [Caldilineaceae bacterium]|uniref:Iron-sulfur cluster insertion protein ErpA n=1 Tax=Caldilineaceae bacterium SB0664_bin_27 TaxID=2605260 RepID=A0A6B0Z2F1_9CHLR|nr:iron-sulfur cluster insertion protein ErpA [Caldilineaceae bacterium]MDE0338927.1 iron-sulfur cluster insertion protein ErpA [Caldilineaceae bacterium]MXY96052.1 iron-sulfur cluster insertion protein ErpA [Caldilineaceae bacterium SB0664_bin_27]
MDITLTDTATQEITLTATAAEKLGGILDQKGLRESHALRVFVKGGGCGGMQYGMTFDDDIQDADQVFEQFGLRVVVDPTSFFYVGGSSIDYIDNLMGGGFHIENPNAVSSCGCGSSFRTNGAPAGAAAGAGCGSGGCGH